MKRNGIWKAVCKQGTAVVLTLTLCISLMQSVPAKAQEQSEDKIQAGTVIQVKDPVRVIVVLKDKPLLERGYTTGTAMKKASGKAIAKDLIEQQDALFSKIQKEAADSDTRKGAKSATTDGVHLNFHYTLTLNGMSLTVPYGALAGIKKMEGVEAAFLAREYGIEPMTQESGKMIGRSETWSNGYTGKGMKIAIIDTGLNVGHKVFSPLTPDKLTNTSLTKEKLARDLNQNCNTLHAKELMKGNLTEDQLYHNTKVPYAFDYAGSDVNVEHEGISDHGTHVAGIAAGNETKTPEGTVVGVAKDAQIMVMKVFGGESAFDDAILAALEDAMVLGADAINMSIGTSAGFSKELPEDSQAIRWLNQAYNTIFQTDTELAISAGNSASSAVNNLWTTNLNPVDAPDNATVGSPSTYLGATSVASIDNEASLGYYMIIGDRKIEYMDSNSTNRFMNLAGKKLDFAMVGNQGCSEDDFTKAKVKGKVAVVQRGDCTFAEKQERARLAGAVGCIVYNNVDEPYLSMAIEETLPCVSIQLSDGKYLERMAEAGKTRCMVSKKSTFFSRPKNVMSSFSSWGVTPDLQLKPEITAPGGNIYSATDKGTYGLMSGTSMAAPHIAGVAALIKQALLEKGIQLPVGELRKRVDALMMSTAIPVLYNEKEGTPYSPRLQGAGLVNAYSSVTSNAYLTVADNTKPKINMGDDVRKKGEYKFSFAIHNTGNHDIQFVPKADVMTEDYVDVEMEGYPCFMSETPKALKDAKVEYQSSAFKDGVITVPGNESTKIEVTITLSPENKAYMDKRFKNGIYVDGFIHLKAITKDDISLSLPYMGFYGDWTAADIFDSPFAENGQNYNMLESELYGNFQGHTSEGIIGKNFNTDLPAEPQHFVISPNGDGTLDYIDDMAISLMRNARSIEISYVNHETGMEYYKWHGSNVVKTMYQAERDQIFPFYPSYYANDEEHTQSGFFDFTYQGVPLENGTKVDLILRGTSDYDKHASGNKNEVIVPLMVDTAAPVISKERMKLIQDQKSGKTFLEVTVSDDTYLASILFGNKDFTNLYSINECSDEDQKINAATGKKTITKTYDVTGYGNEFSMMVSDYGYNCAYFDVNVTDWDQSRETTKKEVVLAPMLADGSATGWDKIIQSIKAQLQEADGSELICKINMRSVTVVPKKLLRAIAGQPMILNLVLEDDTQWKIYAADITPNRVEDTDFKIQREKTSIPKKLLLATASDHKFTQFTVSRESCSYSNGLTFDISSLTQNDKAIANLYYYDQEKKLLLLAGISRNYGGTAGFYPEKGGDYLVVIDSKADISKEMVYETRVRPKHKTLYLKGGKGKEKTCQIRILENERIQEAIMQNIVKVKTTFTSSSAKVAEVRKNGLIIAKNPGKTTITLTYQSGTFIIKRKIKIIVRR
ncbi:MAG: S8 family serine peptidase [Lachnospiraceae bacterium]